MRQEQSETRANAGRIDHPNTIRDRSTTENPSLRPATPIHLFPDGPLAPYLAIFFTKEGPLRKSILTKAVGPDLRGAFDAEAARLAVLGERLRAARTLERTRALFVLGADIRRRVEALKARRGVLDFDDLIAKTLQLVERSDADWLLYKLDRGIDHVLLD